MADTLGKQNDPTQSAPVSRISSGTARPSRQARRSRRNLAAEKANIVQVTEFYKKDVVEIRPFEAISDQILTERLRNLSVTPKTLLLGATMIAPSVDYCAYTCYVCA